MKVKICGITNCDDALVAVRSGADALGFVFFKGSPRYIEPTAVREIIAYLPPFVTTVGVFVEEEEAQIQHVIETCGIDLVQFQGDESPERIRPFRGRAIKAIRVTDRTSLVAMKEYSVRAYLLDSYREGVHGGTGTSFDWDVASEAKRYGLIILAGGLTPENVREAVRHVRPYGVDVSSGVEERTGRKDHEKLRRFIQEAKREP